MPQELSLWDILRSPSSYEELEQLEPWLYACSQGDNLFPIICNTPLIQPDTDQYIRQYGEAILKAMALFENHEECSDWFKKRYSPLSFQDMPMVDTLIEGEGFPGFMDQINLPSFLVPFQMDNTEDLVFDIVGKHHPGLGLDLGCGQGGMTYRMSRICTRVIGVDNHFFLAALANKHMAATEIGFQYYDPLTGTNTGSVSKKPVDNVQIICADVTALPFSEPVFDWVHIGHLIDLIDHPEELLTHIMKILKPGGTLSVATPMDFEQVGHLDEFVAILNEDFTCTHCEESMPWIRYNHKRRWVIHEDWIWIGKLRKQVK